MATEPHPPILLSPIIVDGGWTQWSEWSECVGSCFNGTRTRQRSCTKPEPKNEGRKCRGAEVEENRCLPPECEGKYLVRLPGVRLMYDGVCAVFIEGCEMLVMVW